MHFAPSHPCPPVHPVTVTAILNDDGLLAKLVDDAPASMLLSGGVGARLTVLLSGIVELKKNAQPSEVVLFVLPPLG
jgi:hypothetical protein